MSVICCDKLCACILRHTQKIRQNALLLAYAVTLKLYIIVLSEYLPVLFYKRHSVRKPSVKKRSCKLSRNAGGKADKPL